MTHIRNLIAYWQASLTDADRMSVDSQIVTRSPAVRRADLAAGRVPPEVAAKLAAPERSSATATRFAPTAPQGITVLLCPLVLRKQGPRTPQQADLLLPLWVPAILMPNGELRVPDDLMPWIARDVLEPAERSSTVIGTIEKLDQFLAVNERPASEHGWPRYWSFCSHMFRHVTGFALEQIQVDGYEADGDKSYVMLGDTIQGSRQHILRLYEALRTERQVPRLLQQLASLDTVPLQPLLSSTDQQPLAARHLGQMRSDIALSASQRSALHHFLATGAGEILAVNGPPGTGKTTLIQSVVATLWVEAALNEKEPPVILATSTNNQAVTNIIASFAQRDKTGSVLEQRWLPDVISYGLYCASSTHREQSAQHQYQTIFPQSEREKSGFFAIRETEAYLSQASAYFLDRFAQAFNQRLTSPNACLAFLLRQLRDTVRDLQDGLTLIGRLNAARARITAVRDAHGSVELALTALRTRLTTLEDEIKRFWHIADDWQKLTKQRSVLASMQAAKIAQANRDYFARYPDLLALAAFDDKSVIRAISTQWDKLQGQKKELEAQIQALETDREQLSMLKRAWAEWCAQRAIPLDAPPDDGLDTVLRYRAFCLATHYWEAHWLLETERLLLESKLPIYTPAERQVQRWRRYAKLTPCFVATLFMAPSFFSVKEKQIKPQYNYLDLLIIDEAGQVPTDIGAATFALAKRALVVGDTSQIEPVYALTPAVDAGNLRRSGLATTPDQQAVFRASGLSAVAGSLMVAAQRASRYQQVEGLRGMFLSEHRRCVPEIIAFCNELAYYGRLDPQRRTEKHAPLRDLGLLPMSYVHVPGTCVSAGGSRINQLEAHAIAHWLAEKRSVLEQAYGQPIEDLVGIITPFTRQAALLREALKQQQLPRQLTAGTIHTLQGAEKRIIIFSPVYDSPGQFFFDRGVTMLNVAVSRAQDYFMVFGTMTIFEPGPTDTSHWTRPSSLLARHLFRNEASDLSATLALPRIQPQQATIPLTRLSTLAEHRAELVRGLTQARQRVVIVSPYLSEAAMRADQVAPLIAAAVQRGVQVVVYTDSQLDLDPQTNQLKPWSAAARASLQAAGAQVRVVGRVHNKQLCIDQHTNIEGSFNWLSAVRDESSDYQRHESSMKYEGPGVATMIQNVVAEMEGRLVETGVSPKDR